MHPKKEVLADLGFIVKRSLVTLPVRTSSYTGYHDRLMNMLLEYMYMQDLFTVICLPHHLFLGVRLEIHPVFYAGSLHPEPALSAVQTNRD